MYYAVTITPSPYKSIETKQYRKYTKVEQKEILGKYLEGWRQFFDYFDWVYEEHPTSGNIHVHLCAHPISDHPIVEKNEIIKEFEYAVVGKFGYVGKNNKDEHFCHITVIKTLKSFYLWESYMYKELELIELFSKHII